MNHRTVSKLILLPRTVGLIYLLFLMLFSFDVFEGTAVTVNEILAFLLHSLPSLILFAILIATWRRPFWAGVLFFIFTAAITVLFHTYTGTDRLTLITLPPLLVSVLFFAAYQHTKKISKKEEAEPPKENLEEKKESDSTE